MATGANKTPTDPTLSLARVLRESKSVTQEQKTKLKSLVEESLEARLTLQRQQVEVLKAKLQSVEQSLSIREKNKDRIIERRVEELLDPDINWNALQPAAATSLVVPNPGPGIPFGMPQTGTPIGTPGPPRLPGMSNFDSPSSSTNPESSNNDDADASGLPERLMQRLVLRRKAVDEQDEAIRSLQGAHGPNHSNVVRAQTTLNHTIAEWKQTWKEYEEAVRARELEITVEQKRKNTLHAESERIADAAKRGYVSVVKVKSANAKLRNAERQQLKLEAELKLLKSLATETPHLVPAITLPNDQIIVEKLCLTFRFAVFENITPKHAAPARRRGGR